MGKFAEYMILGYVSMGVLLAGLVFWIYWRYRMLRREEALIDQFEAEEHPDHVAAATGAVESEVQPEKATPGVSGMTGPSSDRARTLPKET